MAEATTLIYEFLYLLNAPRWLDRNLLRSQRLTGRNREREAEKRKGIFTVYLAASSESMV